MHVAILPTCTVCGTELVNFGPGECDWECPICDAPEPEEQKVYTNHCWNCYSPIDSRVCDISPRPDAGYICNNCGCDLEGKVYPLNNNLILRAATSGRPRGGHPRTLS